MKNKNIFLTLVVALVLGFGNNFGATAEEEQKAPEPKTIASVTKILREEFETLQRALGGSKEVNADKTSLQGLMDGNLSAVQGQLRDLVRRGVAEFRALTGLVEADGKLRFKKAFHEAVVSQYEEGLESLTKAQTELSSSENNRIAGFISLVTQRIRYYGGLRNLYAGDSENFSTISYLSIPVMGDIGGVRYIYPNNPNLIFLTVFVEEEGHAEEAVALLRNIQQATGDSSEKSYESYRSEALSALRKNVTGELSLVQLQETLFDIAEKELVIVDGVDEEEIVLEGSGEVATERASVSMAVTEEDSAVAEEGTGVALESSGEGASEGVSVSIVATEEDSAAAEEGVENIVFASSSNQPTPRERSSIGKGSEGSRKNRNQRLAGASDHEKYMRRRDRQQSPWDGIGTKA